MERSQRIVFASFLLLFAVVAVLLSASAIQLSYPLPNDDGTATTHYAAFEPAVISTVVAAIVGVVQLGFLIWNLVAEPPTFTWWVALGLVIIACGWTIFMLFQPTPLF